MKTFVRILFAWCLAFSGLLYAADQKGAELTKKPVSADVVVPKGTKPDDEQIGNIRIKYEDGSKDLWTTKSNCSLPRVAPDGIVGWTVHAEETKIAASYTVRPNGTLVLCKQGKVYATIKSGRGFIEEWQFIDQGTHLVLVTRGAHGPADIELHDVATGKLLKSVKPTDDPLPAWAKPYYDR